MEKRITRIGQSALGLWLAVFQRQYESITNWHAKFNSVSTEDSVSCVLCLGVLAESLMSTVVRHALLDNLDQLQQSGAKSLDELRQLENDGTVEIMDSTWATLSGKLFKQYFGKGFEGLCDSSVYESVAALMRQRNFFGSWTADRNENNHNT